MGQPAGVLAELPAWARALLAESRVARLATIGAGGRPHLVPVCYAVFEARVYIAIDEKPKRGTELARIRNIHRDPRVTLLVDHYADDWTQLAWLRLDGTATVHDHGDAVPAALAALRQRYQQYETMALERLPLVAITVERVAWWRWE